MRDLHDEQIAGIEPEMIAGNVDSNYEIPVHEKHLIHVEMESRSFSPTTGDKLSVPKRQSFYPKDFDRMEKANAFRGKTVTLIHDPSENAEDHKKLLNESNKSDVNGTNAKNQIKSAPKKGADATKGKGNAPKKPTAGEEAKLYIAAVDKYKELYGEEPSADATREDLEEAIQSKLDEQQ